MILSRELLLGDGPALLARVLIQLSASWRRLRSRQVAQTLEAATIASTSASGLDVAALDEGIGLMRTKTTPTGELLDLPARFLVIPANLEATARVLTTSMQHLDVVPCAHLAGDACYLMADPTESPVLVSPIPIGIDDRPSVVPTRPIRLLEDGSEEVFDGQGLRWESFGGMSIGDVSGCVKIGL
jgi:hypothetical protein